MTRRGALPENVDLRRMTFTGTDTRNNALRVVDKVITNVPARVDVHAELEVIADRDRKLERITAVIPAQWGGATLDLDAHDEILFNNRLYELDGDAILAPDHAGRTDHYELNAYRVVG